ncbi:MAG TPA: MMPL family transporter, partial [Nocardioides sp.]|nr:MMPL family transporter [Nocardioides sp.]
MFAALGRFVSQKPWWVVGAWLLIAGLVIAFAPGLKSTTDQSSFLPSKYESIKAANTMAAEFPEFSTQSGATLAFSRTDGAALTAQDLTQASSIVKSLNDELPGTFQKLAPAAAVAQSSPDKLAAKAAFGVTKDRTAFDKTAMDDAQTLRDDAAKLTKGTDLTLYVGGPAAQQLDSQNSSAKTMAIVGAATVVLIVLLLALIFRSVIICLLPILVVGLVSQVATGLIGWANEAFNLQADSSLEVILIVVLYGIGTDYILFLLFRHRERLRLGEDVKTSIVTAMERAGEAIASAGGAVIVAFSALILSSLGIFKAIGPALAIAVAVTLVAALTLVPAVVTLLGKALFWPSKKWRVESEGARFAKIGDGLGKRPALFAAGSGLILVVLALFSLGFHPSFDFTSSQPKDLESSKADAVIQTHFSAGATDPALVVLKTSGSKLTDAQVGAFAGDLGRTEGVSAAAPIGPISSDGTTAVIATVLKDAPGSDAAAAAVKGPIRSEAHAAAQQIGATAYVGGTTSVFVDIDAAMVRDYKVVFPVAAAIILLILALLLRSLVAPWYLMVSVGLGFLASLGATVLVIQHIKGDDGLIFMLPIYIYLFVVALGTDYNILMIARLREEAREGREPRAAAAEAVKHAGPTIAAAGVILAGTFASLMLGGNSLIVSMGFALSFGIFT